MRGCVLWRASLLVAGAACAPTRHAGQSAKVLVAGTAAQCETDATRETFADECSSLEEAGSSVNLTDFDTFKVEPHPTYHWPALYLLGVQESGTTALGTALEWCGLVSYGTAPAHGLRPELLHGIDLSTDEGRKSYTAQYDDAKCDSDSEACKAGRFLESTPLFGSPDAPGIESLYMALPERVRGHARFAYVFREPVSRLLSYYNRLKSQDENSVSEFATFTKNLLAGQNTAALAEGQYIDLLDTYKNASGSRGQLLILSYDLVLKDPSRAVNILTTFYGLPKVISSVSALPKEKEVLSDKTVAFADVDCESRDALHEHYAEYNQRLIARLQMDRAKGVAPALEPDFRPFAPPNADCPGAETHEAQQGTNYESEFDEEKAQAQAEKIAQEVSQTQAQSAAAQSSSDSTDEPAEAAADAGDSDCDCSWADSGSCDPKYEDGSECRTVCCAPYKNGASDASQAKSESTDSQSASSESQSASSESQSDSSESQSDSSESQSDSSESQSASSESQSASSESQSDSSESQSDSSATQSSSSSNSQSSSSDSQSSTSSDQSSSSDSKSDDPSKCMDPANATSDDITNLPDGAKKDVMTCAGDADCLQKVFCDDSDNIICSDWKGSNC